MTLGELRDRIAAASWASSAWNKRIVRAIKWKGGISDFTGSASAAALLVPATWASTTANTSGIAFIWRGPTIYFGTAVTPAMALCVARLNMELAEQMESFDDERREQGAAGVSVENASGPQ